jgi:hypothetical protein
MDCSTWLARDADIQSQAVSPDNSNGFTRRVIDGAKRV